MRKIFQSNGSEKLIIYFLIISFATAVALAIFVHFSPLTSPDIKISQTLQKQNSTVLMPLMKFVSFFGDIRIAFFSVLFSAFFFIILSQPKEALFLFLTLPASGLSYIFKFLVNRPRPDAGLIEVYQRLPDPGFPSGHVAYYVIFFGFIFTLMLTTKKLPLSVRIATGLLSMVLIFSVSFSRIYLGVHWATDVIGGYLLGFTTLSALLYFYFREPRNKSRAS